MATAAPVGDETAAARPPARSVASQARALRLSTVALVLAGLVSFGLVLGMAGLHNGFSTDEVDYLAKVVPGTPHLYWTSVRAWGTPLLAAPLAVFSPGLGLVRLYFAILLSAAVVLAYLPWRRVLHPGVAPLAALLFATTSVATFYGNNVMPNYPIAVGSVAATGLWALLPQSDRRRRALVGLALVVGAVALIRPSDSVLLAAPLAAMTLVVRRRDRTATLLALLVGEAIGWVPWVVEAYVSFGGPLARWHAANTQLTGLQLRFVMIKVYPRLFDGSPGYCCYDKPVSTAGPASAAAIAWMVGFLVLAVIGLLAAWRWRRLSAVGACAAVAGTFFLMYVGLLDYGAMRFLLPIIAMLAIPIATLAVWALQAVTRRRVAAAAVGCLGLLGAHLAVQIDQDLSFRPKMQANRRVALDVAAQTRTYVRDRPCLVVGPGLEVLAYYLGCHVPGSTDIAASVRRASRSGWSIIAVPKQRRFRDAYAFLNQAGWVRLPLKVLEPGAPAYVYLGPGTSAPAALPPRGG